MTRDHDMKRAVRARMNATGEKYTVARSALVAPGTSRTESSKTSESQGGTVTTTDTSVLTEVDERGYAVLRSFIGGNDLARLGLAVDEAVSATLAEKQTEDRERRAAGETGFIDLWSPGEPGGIFADLTAQPDVAWILQHQGLLDIARALKGTSAVLRRAAAWVTLPGYGHQGLHPNADGPAPEVGSWAVVRFVVVLSAHHPDTGTFRAIPGSHRNPPFFNGVGSAMSPHTDEDRTEAYPGDVIVYSEQLWKSGTFNGGVDPLKCVLVD